MESLTIPEAAKRLGISVTAVRDWLEVAGAERRSDSRGRRKIDISTMQILETVKNLRANDHGFETIRRRIAPLAESMLSAEGGRTETSHPAERTHADTEQIVAQVVAAIGNQTDLAEKYARAAHQIGGMENEVKHLSALVESLRVENGELRTKILLLEAPMEAPSTEAKRPWWKLW